MRTYAKLLTLGCCFATTAMLAQVIITSTVLGTVTDPQGAAVPDAKAVAGNPGLVLIHQRCTFRALLQHSRTYTLVRSSG